MAASCDEQHDCDHAGDANKTDDGERARDSTGIGKEAETGVNE